jgi:hypothetical protein
MEITGTINNSQSSNQYITAARAADTPPIKRSDITNEMVRVPAVENTDMSKMDEKRLADMKRVIERNSFKDTFAVRDTSFTIFKDKEGQYITRFTSLRDGSVTYVQEKDVMAAEGLSSNYMSVSA